MKLRAFFIVLLSSFLFACGGENSGAPSQGGSNHPVESWNVPLAQSVNIQGDVFSGKTIYGNYTYFDPNSNARPENSSEFRWIIDNVTQSITSESFDLVNEHVGKDIVFCVTPIALGNVNFIGDEVCSFPVTVSEPSPITTSLDKIGQLIVGDTVSADYTCDNCNRSLTTFLWQVDRNEDNIYGNTINVNGVTISDSSSTAESLTIENADVNKKVRLSVVTYSQSGQSSAQEEYNIYSRDSVHQFYTGRSTNAGLRNDGVAFSWGGSSSSGLDLTNVESVSTFYLSNIVAAKKKDNSVVYWGFTPSGTESNALGIAPSFGAVAIWKTNGSVVTYGDATFGGDISGVSGLLDSGVVEIVSNNYCFSARKDNGDVIFWGGFSCRVEGPAEGLVATDIQTLYRTSNSMFAGIDSQGHVKSWGSIDNANPQVDFTTVEADLQGGVSQIAATGSAFAARKSSGKVVTWGFENTGGTTTIPVDVTANLQSGVISLSATQSAFAALKSDGTVVTWGNSTRGGNGGVLTNIKSVVGNDQAFAAIKNDNTVVAWGGNTGGTIPGDISAQLVDVNALYASPNGRNFAALTNSGKVLAWGANKAEYDAIASQVSVDVVDIKAGWSSFIAIKKDGSVVVWGWSAAGGDPTTPDDITNELRADDDILLESSL
ncbi:MAG: hypothetical protein GY919_14500 [Photobacterium aquimaris]|nr:hypothetical protein [Photobacterium aquimaris]